MEKSNRNSVTRRLLALALSILLIISILPVNLLTVWAEKYVSVDVTKEGNGYVFYDDNGSLAQLRFNGRIDQDHFDIDPDPAGDTVTTLRFYAAGENGIVSKVKILKADGTNETINGGEQELSVALTKDYFRETYLDGSVLHTEVEFGTKDPETVYTVKAGDGTDHASIYVINGDGEEPTEIDGTGRQYTELPLTIQVTPESAAYTIDSVRVNDGAEVALDSNNRFQLTEDMFDAEHAAVINVSVSPVMVTYKLVIPASETYDVWVSCGGESNYPAEPQTGDVELTFPAWVKVKAADENYLVTDLQLFDRSGALDYSPTDLTPGRELIMKLPQEVFQTDDAEQRLMVTLAQGYDISLADGSSQYAQVTAFVKQNGSYPETGTEITAGAPLAVASGSDVKIVVTALEGHTLKGITVSNAEPAGLTNDGSTATFVLNGVAADQPIKVTTGDLYKIQLNGYGETLGYVNVVTATEILKIGSGSYLWLTAEQLDGAHLSFRGKSTESKTIVVSDLTIGGEQELTNNKTIGAIASKKSLDAYTFSANTLSVDVTFKQLLTLTVASADHGVVTGTCGGETFAEGQTYSVYAGDTISFTANPDNEGDYIVQSVELSYTDGSTAESVSFDTGDGNVASFSVTLSKDATVTVTFAKRASFSDITFYWGAESASYLAPLYATDACQVYVFAPYSNSGVKLNMKISSGSKTYPVFFNNRSGYDFYDDDQYHYTDQSTAITFLSYAQGYDWLWGYYNWASIKAPGSATSTVQHMAIVIDRDAPTVELTQGRDGQYYSGAPVLAVAIGEPVDGKVTAAITDNKLPAEAADHAFSGLSKLYYYIGAYDENKEPGDAGTTLIWSYDAGSCIQNDSQSFTVDPSALTDGAMNTVTIVAVDRAGNKGYKTLSIGYNTKLGLTFDDVEYTVDEEDGIAYYLAYRTATILVRDTPEGFNSSGISFTGSSTAYEVISGWSASGEENTYTCRIRFKDGSYQLTDLCYESKNLDEGGSAISTSIQVNETFVVDTTPPSATLKIDGDDEHSWSSLLTGLNFGVWKSGAVTIKATFGDDSGQIKKKEYYIHEYTGESDVSFLTEQQLKDLYETNPGAWKKYPSGGISVGADKRFVIYLRVQKKAGRVSYISTNGIITDQKDPTVTLQLPPASHTHGGKNLYGRDGGVSVDVTVSVADPEIHSGLKTVEYWISTEQMTNAEAEVGTGWTTLISYSPGAAPAYADLVSTFGTVLPVKKAEFNACGVYVYLKVTDNAGRVTVEQTSFDVDNTDPQIGILYEATGEEAVPLIAWITYTERTAHFNKTNAENNLIVKGSDANGEITLVKDVDYRFAGWTDTEVDGDPDAATHVLKVELLADARYEITASFTDLAGNSFTTSPEAYTLDTTPPYGTITVEGKSTWDKLLEALSFGLWSNETVTVKGTAKDKTSVLKSIAYYKTTDTSAMDAAALDALAEEDWTVVSGEWGSEASFDVTTVPADEEFVVYLRIVDNEDNVMYLSTDGVVVDEMLEPSWITLTPAPDADGNGLYNREDNVTVDVDVRDYDTVSMPNSGIKLVTYQIAAANGETETGTLYSYEYTRDEGENSNGGHLVVKEYGETILDQSGVLPAYEDLTHDWSGTISVDKAKFNSCETTITVKVTDNAGNEAENSVVVDIDNTDPTIAIARDEAKCVKLDGADEDFYNAYTALITYTERTHHFSEADAEAKLVVTATNADGDLALTRGVDYLIVGWQHNEDPADPDKDVHVMEIEFLTDANYKLHASYTDLAGNSAADEETSFTLDTQAPDGTITVDGKGTWNKLLETLSFGLWSKESLDVAGTAKDAVCSVKSVKYYLTDETAAKDLDTLLGDSIAWVEVPGAWTTEASFDVTTIDPDQKCVIYLRLMDRAGNVNIICTDGVVVEKLLEQNDITLGASKASGKDAEGKPVYGIRDDVVVTVNVKDREPWSGIKQVTYEITAPDCGTEAGILYSYEYTRDEGDNANGGHLVIYENGAKILDETGVVPAYEDLTHEWNGTIPVNKEQFNSCQTTVKVKVTDNAGNTTENAVTLDIDNTRPTIDVTYATEKNPRAVDNYYTAVTATVTITERDHHFDPAAATAGILVKGTDVSGKDLNVKAGTDYIISGWEKKEGAAPDDCKHVATIKFLTDANYTLNISYTDRATNEAQPDYENAFTKDATQPEGTLRIEKLTDETWINKIIDTLTFALFSRESVEVAHTASDEISPLIFVDYFRTDRDTVYSETELAALAESSWQSVGSGKFAAGSLSVGPDARVVVYLRVIDAAGNIRYVSTDGFILDATDPTNDTVAPKVTISQPVNGIYNTDVPIRVQVSDPIVNGSYSGLKEIRYEVKNMGAVTQSGTLYTYSGTAGKQSDLLQHWENEAAVTVDKEKNNSNNVEIIIYAVDNAGNESHDSVEIKIDVTAPTISVSYDNNNGDTAFADSETDAYFNAPRTATIVVTERNFDPKAVILTVTKDGAPQTYDLTWTTNPAGGNGDGTTHTARIVFDADGDYTFAISCTDLAGNQNKDVTYNGLAPERFTIDMTKPTIQVKYDNNDQKNETYFNAPRTATVTIEEHNFEKTRVEVRLTAKYEGENITLPKVSDWTSSGDTHTATIAYQADGDYTFDIVYKDKAGNENMPVVFASGTQAGSEFTVDTTPPAVTISGIDPKSANTDETISLTVTATDTNFDVFEPVLTKYYLKDGKPVHEPVDIAQYISAIDNGMQLSIPDLDEDGVYVLTCTVVDKAGNAFTEFTGNDGKTVQVKDLTADEGLLIFSVNRLGSTFYADENTIALFDQYYVETVLNDVVIYEINPDVLTEHSVSMNSEELAENRDYTVTEEKDENWNRYTYKISKDLFTAEGFYDLVIVSKDAAGNTANTNRKNVRSFQADEPYRAEFVVDKTPPVVSVSGLEDNGRYQTEEQTVTLLPVDDGGMLGSLLIEIWDENGKLLETKDLSGEDLQNMLRDNDGKIEFKLAENSDQYYVYVTCTDVAGNETKMEFKEVTVSTSALRIFWANKPLRWGSIGGVGGAGALAFFLLLAKKRKKKEEEVAQDKKA